ncbi:phage tail protein [Oxalobacter paraformigenes]|uniref:Phage tail collar domain-containing protein n=1 Tax=Oxalobacter paraformigenes TaxID=556268 RepID=C3X3V2_9BURK|nr:hypothetical protein OFAG_01041 [Oxalobacter paraformigenes]
MMYILPVAPGLRPKTGKHQPTRPPSFEAGSFFMENDMTQLPEKNLLDGSKLPKTTTGEMKDALGKLRDYLNELLGEDSADKEAARLALGIDLAELDAKIDMKAGQDAITAIETAVQDKVDKTVLESRLQALEEKIVTGGIPVGTIVMFTAVEAPAGYLKCDGSAVGRETYPDLYATIKDTYGSGDGETTFNLPNLIGRFAEGSVTPGTVREAGLPNITASAYLATTSGEIRGAAYWNDNWSDAPKVGNPEGWILYKNWLNLNASRSSPIYGNSHTVQPPALTLLPCVKAFQA